MTSKTSACSSISRIESFSGFPVDNIVQKDPIPERNESIHLPRRSVRLLAKMSLDSPSTVKCFYRVIELLNRKKKFEQPLFLQKAINYSITDYNDLSFLIENYLAQGGDSSVRINDYPLKHTCLSNGLSGPRIDQISCDPTTSFALSSTFLSHTNALKGVVSALDGTKVNLEGSERFYMCFKTIQTLKSYSSESDPFFSGSVKAEIVAAFELAALCLIPKDPRPLASELLKRIKEGKITIVPTGYFSHALNCLFYQNLLFFCDKSKDWIFCFEFDSNKIDEEMLFRLIKVGYFSLGNSNQFIKKFKKAVTVSGNSSIKERINRSEGFYCKKQTVGNCAFATCKETVRLCFFLKGFKNLHSCSSIGFEIQAERAKRLSKEWSLHTRKVALEEFFTVMNKEDSEHGELVKQARLKIQKHERKLAEGKEEAPKKRVKL